MLVGQSSEDEVHECGPESGYNRLLEIYRLVVLSVANVIQERLNLFSLWFDDFETLWVGFFANRLKEGQFLDGNDPVADDCGFQNTIFESDVGESDEGDEAVVVVQGFW